MPRAVVTFARTDQVLPLSCRRVVSVQVLSDLNPHSSLALASLALASPVLRSSGPSRLAQPLTRCRRASHRHARIALDDSRGALLPTARSCGHFASKSRRYSTTLGAIRGERRAYRQRQAAEHARELLPAEQDTTLVITRWEFAGVGYLTSGDAALALSAAARAREQRQAAREAA